LLYTGGLIRIGTFRCSPESPDYRDSGPIQDFNVVFPRGAWYIQHEGQPPFLASPLVAPVYNDGQRYERRALERGVEARSDWIAITDRAEVAEMVSAYDPAAADRPDRPLPFRCAPASRRAYWRQRWLLVRLLAAPPLDRLRVEEEAMAIFSDVVREGFSTAPLRQPPTPSDRELFEAARATIARLYRQPLELAVLSAELGISVSRLCRAFRRHGSSVHRTILDLRLRAALEAVLEGESDLTTVALDLGFSSHSHFTAAFRSAYRMTPSQARRLRRRGWRAPLGEPGRG
jgi:AraC-like DNA-binding protein